MNCNFRLFWGQVLGNSKVLSSDLIENVKVILYIQTFWITRQVRKNRSCRHELRILITSLHVCLFVLFWASHHYWCSVLPLIGGIGTAQTFFLTRLVQNLTLRNDCNLIPSAHETQQLSSQSDHWTSRGFTSWSLPICLYSLD